MNKKLFRISKKVDFEVIKDKLPPKSSDYFNDKENSYLRKLPP